MSAKPPRLAPRAAQTRPRRRRRPVLRLLLGTLLLAAGLGAGHALLWHWMAERLEAGFAGWAALQRTQGWQVTHGPPARGGWPFAATLTLPQFRLEGGEASLPGGMAWQADRLVLRLQPPQLDRLQLDLAGQHRLRLGEADVAVSADRLHGTLPLDQGALPGELRLEGEGLRLGTAADTVALRTLQLTLASRTTATADEPAVTLRGAADDLTLPADAGPALATLGRTIGSVVVEAALSAPVPPGRSPAARAAAWREGGGTLDLRSLALRWGPVAAFATATLALDEALQPMGGATLRLSGGAEALDAAAAAGLMPARTAATARTFVRLLSRTPPEGGPPELEVPLTLENRTLSLARMAVARLPAWHWPATARPHANGPDR
jgi:hypothetical protein